MSILYAGTVAVQYGQVYLEAGGRVAGDMAACFAGQSNGLCGAAQPGMLFLVTGLHTGIVGFEIVLLESEPALDAQFEDVVEASLQVTGAPVMLVEWAEDTGRPLALMAGSYRVRYGGRNLDAAQDQDTNAGPDPIDQYRLELWPASPAPDRVVRQSSAVARYWNDWAQTIRLR